MQIRRGFQAVGPTGLAADQNLETFIRPERYLQNQAQAQQLHGVRLCLVCLMPNHFHLLVETPSGNLSAFMARVLTAYTVFFKQRHRRAGDLTQGRFKAQVVEGSEYLLKLSRYIHLNPVCGKSWKGVPLV